MKKNISINISGIIFHIEEDGYDRLKGYLDSINKYFSSYEDSFEIIADIEGRIAEIFLAKINEDMQVITSDDVDSLITTMGTIADFEAAEETETPGPKQETQQPKAATSSTEGSTSSGPKRLYRDVKRRIIGGVCSGIAHYFNVDPMWVRLAFILLLFNFFVGYGLSGIVFLAYVILWIVVPGSTELEEDQKIKKMYRNPDDKVLGGVAGGIAAYFGADPTIIRILFVLSAIPAGAGIIVYIILWIITPEAASITEKMQMQGEPVTLSNIESNIKERLKVESSEEESVWVKILLFPFRLIAMVFKAISDASGPFVNFLLEALRVVAGVLLIILGVGVILCFVLAIVAFFGAFPGLGDTVQMNDIPIDLVRADLPFITYFSAFIVVTIPFLVIAMLGFAILLKTSVTNAYIGWSIFGIWILGLIGAGISVPSYIYKWTRTSTITQSQDYDIGTSQAVLDLKYVGYEDYDGVKLRLKGHADSVFVLKTNITSRGSGNAEARENAGMVEYVLNVEDSVFYFNSNLTFKDEAKFREQKADLTFSIPYNRVFYLKEPLQHILRNTLYRNGYSADQMEDNQWVFKENGSLKCLTCKSRYEDREEEEEEDPSEAKAYNGSRRLKRSGEDYLTFSYDDFSEIEASDNFEIEISIEDDYRIEVYGRAKDLKNVDIDQRGRSIDIDYEGRWRSIPAKNRVKVFVSTPELEKLDLGGSSKAFVKGLKGRYLEIDLGGNSDADIDAILDRIEVDLSGTSSVKLYGEADRMVAEADGASHLNAYDFIVESCRIKTRGAADAKLHVLETLSIDAGGSSNVRYKGDPNVRMDESGGSSIRRI